MADTSYPSIVQLTNQWRISGDVLMDNANQILVESSAFLMGKDSIEIDFSQVRQVDTAAISLIFEWQRRAVASHCKICFSHVPANLSSLASLYGVAEFIPLSAS